MPGLRQRIDTAIAELPPVYWTLWVGTIVNRLGGFVVPFLAFYLTREREFSTGMAGAVVSLYGVGSVAAATFGGVLADRLGRRPTLLLGLIGGGFAMLGLGFARSVTEIGIMALLLGLLGDVYRPAVMAVVADVVPIEKRRVAFGNLYWAINLGFAGASIIAGAVAGVSYLALFVADAATTFAYAFVIWRWVPETRPAILETPGEPASADGMLTVLRDPVFLPFIVFSVVLSLVFQQSMVTLPLAMSANGHSAAIYGLVIGLNGVLIVALQPAATRGTDGMRRSRVLAVASVLTGIGFGLYSVTTSAWGYALGVVFWTLGEIASAPAGSSIVADLAPSHLRGRYQGVYAMSWGIGALVGPGTGAYLMDRVGERPLWLGCLALGLIAAVGHLAIGPARRRRMLELRAKP